MGTDGKAIAIRDTAGLIENVVVGGDLSKLTSAERVSYYRQVCGSLGLNPYTKPFDYIDLDGKLTLYAKRDATDQLRKVHGVSVNIVSRERLDGLYVVTARATTSDGRTDEAVGAVAIEKEGGEWKTSQSGKRYFAGNGEYVPLRGDALANAIMKAETKSKRRATLSIVGLGWLDETETDTIPNARVGTVQDIPTEEAIASEAQPVAQPPPTPEPAPAVAEQPPANPTPASSKRANPNGPAMKGWQRVYRDAQTFGVEADTLAATATDQDVISAMAVLRARIVQRGNEVLGEAAEMGVDVAPVVVTDWKTYGDLVESWGLVRNS
jgi:hypothetical protein